VQLDARPVRTPGKALLVLPTQALAEEIAGEWDAQQSAIDPRTMPLTRAANSAIDKVMPQQGDVIEMLVSYGDADLTCYRAAGPQQLVMLQAAAWDPLLDWAEQEFGTRLQPRTGVIHAPQDPETLQVLHAEVAKLSIFQLAGFHDLVTLSGSLIIGLAACHRHLSAVKLWSYSRIDEDWQEAQWGQDDEATAMAAAKRQAFLEAELFFRLSAIS
jgi:chaperone required for assembly of F1-ATPase